MIDLFGVFLSELETIKRYLYVLQNLVRHKHCWILYIGCCLKVVNYIFCSDMFHSFSTEKDWYVIHFISFNFSPFIYACVIFACFQSFYWDYCRKKIMVKIGVAFWFFKYSASNVGSLALCGLILNKSFCIPGEASQTRV